MSSRDAGVEDDREKPAASAAPAAEKVLPDARFAPARALLEEAVAEHVFPGAVFGVAQHGRLQALEAVGRFTYAPESPLVTTATPYDLASLSKVLATTAAAMVLWQDGLLALDCPLGELLPGFVIGTGSQARLRRLVTVRMLLAHSSGLPAYSAFYEQSHSPRALLQAALSLPLLHAPGEVTGYSDPGFILLGKALEVLADQPLDLFCRQRVFSPLGMHHTLYNPVAAMRATIPPTEQQNGRESGIVQGTVHDENCRVMNGVGGHAGLFAPASDVLRFADAMLQPLRAETGPVPFPPLFTSDVVKLFTRRVGTPEGSSRALGWDTPSDAGSSSGDFFGSGSFGHLGFTGTSLWVDPVADIAVVLLSNRTFPTRDNDGIRKVRPQLHNAVRKVTSGS